jgi:WhiB family redox-sensing transcriptional regulator
VTWQDQAACRGKPIEWFYPPERTGSPGNHTADAKRICRLCPVRPACLEFALQTDDRWAVLGGLDPEERARLRRAKTASRLARSPR